MRVAASRRISEKSDFPHKYNNRHQLLRHLIVVLLLLLLGAVLRIGVLGKVTRSQVRFHPDEALYASFARRVSLHGDFLLSDAALDKPPLVFFLTAGSFSIFEATEFAARLPTVFISILTLAVVYALTHCFYRDGRTALITLLLLALSPFDLAFAATAFLDPLLTLFLLLTLLFICRGRWYLAGLMFILAVATKQSALFFLPLILSLGVAADIFSARNLTLTLRQLSRRIVSRLIQFAVPILIGGVLLALWSVARAASVDFWTLGALNNNPGRFIRANEVLPRLERWLTLLSNVTGFWPILLIVFVPLFIRLNSPAQHIDLHCRFVDLMMLTFVLAMLLFYWLVAFNTYDRYLHTLTPLLLILVARGITAVSRLQWIQAKRIERFVGIVAISLVILSIMPFTLRAVEGQIEIGGDHGQYTGMDRLAAMIKALPPRVVVHNYWLGWELGFYLGEDQAWRSVFQPSPEAVIRTICQQNDNVQNEDHVGYFAETNNNVDGWLAVFKIRHPDLTVKRLLDGPVQLYELRIHPLNCP